jgi:hypothetical protein
VNDIKTVLAQAETVLFFYLQGEILLIYHLLFTSHLANSHPSPSPFDTAANKKPASGPCGFFICLKSISGFETIDLVLKKPGIMQFYLWFSP